jgi:predicted Zn-dependent protease with MMP-like domain
MVWFTPRGVATGRSYADPMDDRHARYRSADSDRRRRPSSGYRPADAARFDGVVARAIASLPRGLLAYLDGTRVAIEDLPPLDDASDETWPPLGRYRDGPAPVRDEVAPNPTDRADAVAGNRVDPADATRTRGTLTFFRHPLQARARDRADLEDLIREVVVDDLARRFDLDDDQLDELGWG